MLKFMKAQKLPVSNDSIIVKAKEVIKRVEEFKKKKGNLDFPTDGLVIKLNSLAKRDALGATAHSPFMLFQLKSRYMSTSFSINLENSSTNSLNLLDFPNSLS